MVQEKLNERIALFPVFLAALVEAKILQALSVKRFRKANPFYWTEGPTDILVDVNCTFDLWLFETQRYDLVDWVLFEPYPPLRFYDPLKQIKLQPNLRESTILKYSPQGIEGLFNELQNIIK